MISGGCGSYTFGGADKLDEAQFAEGEAIAVVVDSITQGSAGQDCFLNPFSEEYIGHGVWRVTGEYDRPETDRAFPVSWKVYENSLKASPDRNALMVCYRD